MRILVLNREYPPIVGGGAVMTKALVQEWARLGHQVDVVASKFGDAPAFEEHDRVCIFRVHSFTSGDLATLRGLVAYIFFSFFRGLRLCHRQKYDVMFSFFAIPAGLVGHALSKIYGIRHVAEIIGADIYEPTRKLSAHRYWIIRVIVRHVMNSADAVLAPAKDIKGSAVKYFHPKANIVVVPIGLQKPTFKALSRQELGLDPSALYVIGLGVMLRRKNFPGLVKAFSLIKNSRARLILMGDGPMRPEIESLVRELSLTQRVTFAGKVSDERKFQLLSVADIFVLPSFHEGFGIVNQEAMYFGLGIVSGNVGGIIEFYKDGQNALLVDPTDASAMAASIERLLDDGELRRRLGQQAQEDVKEQYIEIIAAKYLTFAHG